MMDIIMVKSNTQIRETERLADIVWHEHFNGIISLEQIEYMLEKFQSFNAIMAQIQDKYNYFLLVDNKLNIGYTSYKIIENTLFLSKIYILSEHRGKGHAKEAMEYLKKIAQAKSSTKIWLTVNQYNHSSIKAYEKMGFINARTQVADIGNGFFMEDYIMELTV